jgi:putative effector of murein hydrolase LrgA (UPF0299 family)
MSCGAERFQAPEWQHQISTGCFNMLVTFGFLLACQLIGEVVVRGLGLPLPGPVLGMVLLVVVLRCRPALAEKLRSAVLVILANLSLMFVPAGVGVVGNLEARSRDAAALIVVLTLSTFFAMMAAVGTFIGVGRLTRGRNN